MGENISYSASARPPRVIAYRTPYSNNAAITGARLRRVLHWLGTALVSAGLLALLVFSLAIGAGGAA